MRWALVSPEAGAEELERFGVECERVIAVPSVRRGMAYVIDPDTFVVTDFRSGVVRTGRELWPEDEERS